MTQTRDEGEALPAALVLFSPMLDMTASGASIAERSERDPLFTTGFARAIGPIYALRELARAAWADGVITDVERADLVTVANLLQLAAGDVDVALAESVVGSSEPAVDERRFRLAVGGLVVFTGDMELSRDAWCERASAVGLVPHPGVTRRVALLVAADPDSLSGKARKPPTTGSRSWGRPPSPGCSRSSGGPDPTASREAAFVARLSTEVRPVMTGPVRFR